MKNKCKYYSKLFCQDWLKTSVEWHQFSTSWETKLSRQTQQVNDKLKVHQFSALAGKNQPEYLIYSEVYSLDTTNPVDGSTTTHNYVKGTTKIDNLAWLNNLGSQLLI